MLTYLLRQLDRLHYRLDRHIYWHWKPNPEMWWWRQWISTLVEDWREFQRFREGR